MGKILAITGGVVVSLFLIGYFPVAGVVVTALGIVFLFLVFGREQY
jgi:hypothetical protein